jgi:hypothetical protein
MDVLRVLDMLPEVVGLLVLVSVDDSDRSSSVCDKEELPDNVRDAEGDGEAEFPDMVIATVRVFDMSVGLMIGAMVAVLENITVVESVNVAVGTSFVRDTDGDMDVEKVRDAECSRVLELVLVCVMLLSCVRLDVGDCDAVCDGLRV